jgi:hypothetical protein
VTAGEVPAGLPEALPEGEEILWQGGPRASALARQAFGLRLLSLYFAGAALFTAGMAWSEGRSLAQTAMSLALVAAAGIAALSLVRFFATLVARTTVYTITTRRIVMRIGIALPVTFNLPFSIVEGAGLKVHADGSGDIPVTIDGSGRIGFFHLWPHARPWRLSRPEPMLRCVPEGAQVAAILARALGSGPLGRAAAARADTGSAEPAHVSAAAAA